MGRYFSSCVSKEGSSCSLEHTESSSYTLPETLQQFALMLCWPVPAPLPEHRAPCAVASEAAAVRGHGAYLGFWGCIPWCLDEE